MSIAPFDNDVKVLRAAGVQAIHKPYGKAKADCTPLQWAQHLEWKTVYYRFHREEWNMYRNRWLAKKRKERPE